MTSRSVATVQRHEAAYRRACVRLATRMMIKAGVPRSHFGFDPKAKWLCEMDVLTDGGTIERRFIMRNMGVNSLRAMVEDGLNFWRLGQRRARDGDVFTYVKH